MESVRQPRVSGRLAGRGQCQPLNEAEPFKRKKTKYSRKKKKLHRRVDGFSVDDRLQALQRINLRRDLERLLEAIARAKRTIKENA